MIIALVLVWTMVAALCMLSSSCANMQLKPVQDMTPKEKSLAAMKIYNGLVESYKAKPRQRIRALKSSHHSSHVVACLSSMNSQTTR